MELATSVNHGDSSIDSESSPMVRACYDGQPSEANNYERLIYLVLLTNLVRTSPSEHWL